MKYRKKPVTVDAFQITPEFLKEYPIYCKMGDREMWNQGTYVTVKTLEGDMRGELNDWIITGVKGEVYPCRDDIFRETYDEVTP